MIVEEIWEEISKMVDEELLVRDFAVGVKYSYVIIEGKNGQAMGTAYMPSEDVTRGYSRIPNFDNIKPMLTSTNIMEKSLGMAFLNAVSQYLLWNMNMQKNLPINYSNITDFILDTNPKNVVIGNMRPVVNRLAEFGVKTTVLERNPRMRYNALPDCFASRVLPAAETVVITGAVLVNDTVDYILSQLKNARHIILVGPTAGIYPARCLYGITHIASLRIENIEKSAKIIRLGGGRWDFSQYTTEYIITIKG